MMEDGVRTRLRLPFPCRTLLRVGEPFNKTHVSLIVDLRQWSIGFRWERAYSGLSRYLNLWRLYFSIPLLTLEVVINHRQLP